jgi:hypothetical protein
MAPADADPGAGTVINAANNVDSKAFAKLARIVMGRCSVG